MGNAENITGWITLFMGIYAISAGTGEFRRPGFWTGMLREVQASGAIQFLTGIITITLGATIYLVNPFNPADILSILITVVGGIALLEGVAILAFGDWFLTLAGKMMNRGSKIWAGFAIAIGVIAVVVALARLQVF
ncbi:hypothetical protein AB1K62_00225 [Parasphingorhabdus sp. JC815]|uniref:hypothetical protein n=1 Tax=Parasphingorhabdus sp. JC815 TaxID=3232140 RepID=UPI00345AEE81